VKELGFFALEGMADELERPSQKEKRERVGPQPVDEDADEKQSKRKQNCRDAESVAKPVYGVLMAGGVLRHPLFVGATAQHGT
jgi:hypothetical protein